MNIGHESEKVEYKKSTAELNEGIVSIAAILNKHQRGKVYFGVANGGDIIGQQIGADTLRDISRKIYEQIKPIPNVAVQMLSANNKTYVEVDFHGEEIPYSAKGKYYLRVSDEDREITQSQLRDLFNSLPTSYEKWENELTEFTIDDVDETTLKQNYEDGVAAKRFTEPYSSKKTVLTKLGLLRNGKLTNAGNCLFSKNKPILLKVALFATNEKLTFLDLNHFRGNIFECINEGISFISRSIRWAAEIGEIDRINIPEIPIKAVREIIINSFVHARYQGALSSHEINIFPIKVTIYNPGHLPQKINPAHYKKGKGPSFLRNQTIANVLFRCDKIEAFGTGFHRVYSLCKAADVKYRYSNEIEGFQFEFIRSIITPTASGENIAIKLTGIELRIYQLIKENGDITAPRIATVLEKTERTILRALASLKEKGFIAREGSKKSGKWLVLK